MPWQSCGGAHEFTFPTTKDPVELILNHTGRAAVSITVADRLPSTKHASNVLRPYTALKLSLRIPSTVDGEAAAAEVKQLVEKDTPYGADVTFTRGGSSGWNAHGPNEFLHIAHAKKVTVATALANSAV